MASSRNIVQAAWVNDSSSANVQSAVDDLLMSEASDYWYWDGTEVWDSNPARLQPGDSPGTASGSMIRGHPAAEDLFSSAYTLQSSNSDRVCGSESWSSV